MFTVQLKVTPAGLIARGRGVVKFAPSAKSNRRLVAVVLPAKMDYSLSSLTERMKFMGELR